MIDRLKFLGEGLKEYSSRNLYGRTNNKLLYNIYIYTKCLMCSFVFELRWDSHYKTTGRVWRQNCNPTKGKWELVTTGISAPCIWRQQTSPNALIKSDFQQQLSIPSLSSKEGIQNICRPC